MRVKALQMADLKVIFQRGTNSLKELTFQKEYLWKSTKVRSKIQGEIKSQTQDQTLP